MGEAHQRAEVAVDEARRGSTVVQDRPATVAPGGADVGLLLRCADPVTARRMLGALQRVSGNSVVSRAVAGTAAVQRVPESYVPYQIEVAEPLTREEFRVKAVRQIFGGPVTGVEWRNSKDEYLPAHSPYTVRVSSTLLRSQRATAAEARGIAVDESGTVRGAAERARAFHGDPRSPEAAALMAEIDRRYFATVGNTAQIERGETGKAALWRLIRDEVLFQHEYLGDLPDAVSRVIRIGITGRELGPADYEQLFAIAKKIERLPRGYAADYASKITGSTSDLDVLDAALDAYIAEMAERTQQTAEREEVHTKLIGLEEVYEKYQLYRSLLTSATMLAGSRRGAGTGLGTVLAAEDVREELEVQLQAHGFAGISEFAGYISRFERAFEQGAAGIALDVVGKYAGRLYRESERYQDPAEVAALYSRLGGARTQYAQFEANARIWNDYVRSRIRGRTPGARRERRTITYPQAAAARERAEQAKAAAQAQVEGMSQDHPIFQEEGIPVDERIDKGALVRAGEHELGPLLQAHINRRTDDAGEAAASIREKPELIYKMDALFPQFYAQLGIEPGSIHDKIIRHKMRSDAIVRMVTGIVLAVVAVALAIVSLGTATPAIVAAGTSIAGAGLGAYMALEEYERYTEEQGLADVGLTDDPSVIWLVLAVVGAGLDLAAAVRAVRALGPAARAFNETPNVDEFTRAVRALEEAGQIESRIARAAERAAAARTALAESFADLTRTMAGKVYSFPGPLADPEVYRAVVALARNAIKTKLYDAQAFIDKLQLARVNAGMDALAPEELAKAKQAWREAKALEAADLAHYERLKLRISDIARLDALVAHAGDATALERLLGQFTVPELENIFVHVTDGRHLAVLLDHVGEQTAAGLVRHWMSKNRFAQMDTFLSNLAAGVGRELAESSALGARSLIIDSNTAIALIKDADPALRPTMHAGERARVAFIRSLPADTELRVANVTVGEVRAGAITVTGVPIDVMRSSPAYQRLLAALDAQGLGGAGGKGVADRGLVADAFFATTDPGITPRLLSSDTRVVNKLARMASIDVDGIGGFDGLVARYGTTGFTVALEGRTLTVIPVP